MREASGDDCKVIPFGPRHRDLLEQRAARALRARNGSSDWFDDHWVSNHLPWIRLAAGVLGKNDSELDAAIYKLSFLEGNDDPLSTLFKHWREAKCGLDEMREALEVAMNRSLGALERVRGDPENSPPRCG